MIGVRDQAALVSEVSRTLVHMTAPTCWNLVVPPGFGPDSIASSIEKALARSEPRPLVASLNADTVETTHELVHRLHDQWSKSARLSRLTGPSDIPHVALERLLASLPKGPPVVLVINRFHKVLDSLSSAVLGTLRSFEQGPTCAIRTVTISPYPYEWLRRNWREVGIKLVTSDYGDKHAERRVSPMTVEDVCSACRAAEVPDAVGAAVAELSGGIPETVELLVAHWRRHSAAGFAPKLRDEMRTVAVRSMRYLVKLLDSPGESRYRDLVIDLYKRREPERVGYELSFHPWSKGLVAEDGCSLVTDVIGAAAVEAEVFEVVSGQREDALPDASFERALRLYRLGEYAHAADLLGGSPLTRDHHAGLLRAHADVMRALYGPEGVGADSNWAAIARALSSAEKVLDAASNAGLAGLDLVRDRYSDLGTLAESICAASRGGETRIVDALGGLRGSRVDRRAAIVLLEVQFRLARRVAGPSRAVQLVTPLPEQIARLWSYWLLGLDESCAPEQDAAEPVWQLVEAHWPRKPLVRAEPGSRFSAAVFAYYSHAAFVLQGLDPELALEADFSALDRALSVYDARRDPAHAYARVSSRVRDSYFGLIDRWLERLFLVGKHLDPGRFVSRADLLACVRPLPLVLRDDSVDWLPVSFDV